jgi:glycosyltransferase involved in cell wall biosynthesis
MVRAIRREGIDACIVTTQDNGVYRNPDLPTGRWILYENVPILLHSCIDSRIRAVREYLISPTFTQWLIRNIDHYDLIHFHAIFSFPSTIGMAIARLRRVPYIVRTIGQLSPWSLKQGFIRKKFMIEMIEGANLKHANAIHVTSNYELRDLELLGLDSHGFTLGLGVSLPYQSVNTANDPDQLDKKVSFLYLSRIHPKKQIELLFEALNILKIKLHEENWELALAGTGEADYLDRLKKEAKTLSIDGHLVWHGHVTGGEKLDLMKQSDWFVLTSASENFGISVVEAMAASIPVIITEGVGISDKVLQYSAGYICRENPEEIAEVLKKAIQGFNIVEMRTAARRLVEEKFSWDYIGKSLTNFYSELV